jgi:hypothetical protein
MSEQAPLSEITSPTTATDARYVAQNTNGIYSRLADKILDLDTLTPGGVNYEQNFVRKFTGKGHYRYVPITDSESEKDCHFIIFGQTCPMSLSTQMSARGNKSNYSVCAIA